MKKKWMLGIFVVVAFAIVVAYLLLTAPEIGEKSTYEVVNNFSKASLKLVELSQKEKNITIEYTYTGESELGYGAYHQFEIWQEDGWYRLMPKHKNLSYPDIAYIVSNKAPQQKTYGWAGLGRLPKGRYRFVQEVWEEFDKEGVGREYVLAVEFKIE